MSLKLDYPPFDCHENQHAVACKETGVEVGAVDPGTYRIYNCRRASIKNSFEKTTVGEAVEGNQIRGFIKAALGIHKPLHATDCMSRTVNP